MDHPLRVDPKGISFELGKSIHEVEDDFFLLLPTLKELFILDPDCVVPMSQASVTLFRANRVLLRGPFDGSAEKLAKAHGLRFLHADVELAQTGDYNSLAGSQVITLRFAPGREDLCPCERLLPRCIRGMGRRRGTHLRPAR